MESIGRFFELEGAYLVLAAVILLVTLFVTTRPFMGPSAKKKGLLAVAAFLSLAVAAHYYVTTARIQAVEEAFAAGRPILCESRMLRNMAQSIEIRKGVAGWRLSNDRFTSPQYARPFHAARCILK